MSTEQPPATPVIAGPFPWRGIVAFACMAVVAGLGPGLYVSSKVSVEVYILEAIFLGTGIGVGISGIRSQSRVDRVICIAVVLVGIGLAVLITKDCIRILRK